MDDVDRKLARIEKRLEARGVLAWADEEAAKAEIDRPILLLHERTGAREFARARHAFWRRLFDAGWSERAIARALELAPGTVSWAFYKKPYEAAR